VPPILAIVSSEPCSRPPFTLRSFKSIMLPP
jgi:hypothetical protein